MAAFGLPQGTDEEKAARDDAIQAATRGAIETPLRVMQVALESMEVTKAMMTVQSVNSAREKRRLIECNTMAPQNNGRGRQAAAAQPRGIGS